MLKSFFEEFNDKDEVVLYILTAPYHHDGRSFEQIISDFVKTNITKTVNLTRVKLLRNDLPNDQIPMLYKSVDCFVLPSR